MSTELFIQVSAILAMGMLVWNCFEVGQNDAANLVNAVFGSRVLKRKKAVILAGIMLFSERHSQVQSWTQFAKAFSIWRQLTPFKQSHFI